MDARTHARYEARAVVAKAMAHPTRLFIVDSLAESEMCVADIAGLVGADTSTVSRHLAILKNAGIIGSEKRGLQVFYRLKTPCILNLFGCVESVMKAAAAEKAELAR